MSRPLRSLLTDRRAGAVRWALMVVSLVCGVVAWLFGQPRTCALILICGLTVSIPFDLARSAQTRGLRLVVVADLLWVVGGALLWLFPGGLALAIPLFVVGGALSVADIVQRSATRRPTAWHGAPTLAAGSSSRPTVTPPAWYPDPLGAHELRYWDGRAWTAYVAKGGEVSMAPLPRLSQRAPEPGPETPVAAEIETPAPEAGTPATADETGATPPGFPPWYEPPPS